VVKTTQVGTGDRRPLTDANLNPAEDPIQREEQRRRGPDSNASHPGTIAPPVHGGAEDEGLSVDHQGSEADRSGY